MICQPILLKKFRKTYFPAICLPEFYSDLKNTINGPTLYMPAHIVLPQPPVSRSGISSAWSYAGIPASPHKPRRSRQEPPP